MSSNAEEKPEAGKSYPLDLAPKVAASKASDIKSPPIVPHASAASLRNVRILPTCTAVTTVSTPTAIIATSNIVKQDIIYTTQSTQPQVAGNHIQRQITLQSTPPMLASSPHVPRGASFVASLAPPRSSITATIRNPGPVTAPTATFVRPARAASPAQAWITAPSSANGAATIKNVPAPRAATLIPAKTTPVIAKQPVGQILPTMKPSLLQSTIISQSPLHQFKGAVAGIQALSNAATVAQVVPARQTLLYSAGSTQFATGAPRITLASTQPRVPTITTSRPLTQVGNMGATRLTVPVAMNNVGAPRLLAPQGAILTPTTRLSLPAAAPQTLAPARLISTTPTNVSLGRLAVAMTNASAVPSGTVLTQIRTALVHHPAPNLAVNRLASASSTGKMIVQPVPAAAIQLAPIATSTLKASAIVATTTASRVVNAPTACGTQRSVSAPISKVYTHQEGQPTGIYQLHTPLRTSPGPSSTIAVPTTSVSYSFYDSSGAFPITRAYSQQNTTITAVTQSQSTVRPVVATTSQVQRPTNTAMRFDPIMSVDPNRAFAQVEADNSQSPQNKLTASPRPSILRKREHDGSGTTFKVAKNLMSSLSNMPPQSPPSRPDSRNNGHSSGGSTTISATSSPGLADGNDDSNPPMPLNKDEEENRPPIEMSPRKKPRKQNLTTGNDIDESNEDLQFILERDLKADRDDSDCMQSDGMQDGGNFVLHHTLRRPPAPSLLHGYHYRWKTTTNHYLRYSDVRPKDERKPTIIDLSNQHQVLDKIEGWKIHHLSTQMEEVAEQENMVHNQLGAILKFIETQDINNPDINRVTELIKGNMQRVKIINDGMVDAKTAVMKIIEHKVHVSDIISRCASKRNYKKREKT